LAGMSCLRAAPPLTAASSFVLRLRMVFSSAANQRTAR
jgi:hypothetical protein